MEIDDGTGELNMDFLDHIFQSVCRTRALLFSSPFSITDVLYDTKEQLLQSCGFIYPAMPVMEVDVSETDRVQIFAEGLCNVELKNLETTLKSLDVNVSDRRFCYEKALMVVVDRVSGIPINVEYWHCKWVSSEYNLRAGPDFFGPESGPADMLVNGHSFFSTCVQCKSNHGKCHKAMGGCKRCTRLGLECEAGETEASHRRRLVHASAKRDLSMLCADHQHVIVSYARRVNELRIMNGECAERLTLFVLAQRMVDGRFHGSWDCGLEQRMVEYADAAQYVVFESGNMTITDLKSADEWWGYEDGEKMKKDDRRAVINPHLGMREMSDAVMFIDHAFRSPGQLFYRDECVLNKKFKPVSVRLMAIVSIISEVRVAITLGWKKPL